MPSNRPGAGFLVPTTERRNIPATNVRTRKWFSFDFLGIFRWWGKIINIFLPLCRLLGDTWLLWCDVYFGRLDVSVRLMNIMSIYHLIYYLHTEWEWARTSKFPAHIIYIYFIIRLTSIRKFKPRFSLDSNGRRRDE